MGQLEYDMEINANLKYGIGQTVYFLDHKGNVESGEVRGVIFQKEFQYEIVHYTDSSRNSCEGYYKRELEVFDDVDNAIEYGVEQYRKKQVDKMLY